MQEPSPEDIEELLDELEKEYDTEEALPPEVENLLQNLQPHNRVASRLRAAEQLGKLSESNLRIVQALVAAGESTIVVRVKRAVLKSLRAPVHQEVLQEYPELTKRADSLARQVAAEVENLLQNLQPHNRVASRRRAAEQLGKLSESNLRIVQALVAAGESTIVIRVKRPVLKSLRAPVHQEILQEYPELTKRADSLARQVAAADKRWRKIKATVLGLVGAVAGAGLFWLIRLVVELIAELVAWLFGIESQSGLNWVATLVGAAFGALAGVTTGLVGQAFAAQEGAQKPEATILNGLSPVVRATVLGAVGAVAGAGLFWLIEGVAALVAVLFGIVGELDVGWVAVFVGAVFGAIAGVTSVLVERDWIWMHISFWDVLGSDRRSDRTRSDQESSSGAAIVFVTAMAVAFAFAEVYSVLGQLAIRRVAQAIQKQRQLLRKRKS